MISKIDEKVKAANGLGSLIITLIPLLGAALASAFKGSLDKTQDAVTTGLKSAITKIDNGLDHGLAAFKTFEASNPVVQSAISEAKVVLTSMGMDIPEADVLEAHVKAALFDLFAGIDPQLKQNEGTQNVAVDASSSAEAAPAAEIHSENAPETVSEDVAKAV